MSAVSCLEDRLGAIILSCTHNCCRYICGMFCVLVEYKVGPVRMTVDQAKQKWIMKYSNNTTLPDGISPT